ncbi:MAG: glutathione S-transferase, partial [Pseudomonadota bacterium]
MADARTIILHHYDASPFSEKIRLALRLKNLAWAGVDIPSIAPKPELTALTGGYRRTPVLQIGADIYCDTAVMLPLLDRRFDLSPLALPGHEGIGQMVGAWADRVWFPVSVGVIFGAVGDRAPNAFVEDRSKLMGGRFDIDAMRAAAPMLRDQWREHLMWIETRLQGGRGVGSGLFLVGTKPGLVDVQAHMNVWFMDQQLPEFLEQCFEDAPLTQAWYRRLNGAEGPEPETISAETAIAIAKKAGPRLVSAVAGHEPQGLEVGEKIAVAPDDYGKNDWVEGDLVHADARRVVLRRVDERAET